MKKMIYALAAATLIIHFALPVMAIENATITGDGLRVRDKHSLEGRKVGSVNKGYRVEAVSYSDHTDTIDGFTGHWYFIVYKDITGWVFGKYILVDLSASIPSESEFCSNDSTSDVVVLNDILGVWPLYWDVPNKIFTFYNDGKAKLLKVEFIGDGDGSKSFTVLGSYVFDGKTIQANWSDGTEDTFFLNKVDGVPILTLNGERLPNELHRNIPNEK